MNFKTCDSLIFFYKFSWGKKVDCLSVKAFLATLILPEIFHSSFCLSVHFSQLCHAVFVRVDQEWIINFICICHNKANSQILLVIQVGAMRVQHLGEGAIKHSMICLSQYCTLRFCFNIVNLDGIIFLIWWNRLAAFCFGDKGAELYEYLGKTIRCKQ